MCASFSTRPSRSTSKVGPSATTRPAVMAMTRRAKSPTTSMSWQTIMTVVPFSFSSRTTSITFTHSRKSRPVVGSSRMMVGGASTMIEARASSCRVPRFSR